MEQEIGTKEALEILDQVSSRYLGTREDHRQILKALEVLKKAIEEKKE